MPGNGKGKKRKESQSSGESDENGSSEPVTLELIYGVLLELKEKSKKTDDTVVSLLSSVSVIESKLQAVDTKIADMQSAITSLENENKSLRSRLNIFELREAKKKVRIYNLPQDATVDLIKKSISSMITKEAIGFGMASTVSTPVDIAILTSPKGRYAIVIFSSIDPVNLLCHNSKRIWNEYKYRVSRELTNEQRSEMFQAIDAAKVGKNNPKVSVAWSRPAAFVDGTMVWPPSNARRPGISYSSAVQNKTTPEQIYGAIKSDDLLSPPEAITFSESADPLHGSEFVGFLVPWDGKKPSIGRNVKKLIEDHQVPFDIDKSKDNVIIAAVGFTDGKFLFSTDDGGERGAAIQILQSMGRSKIANAAIIIFRKYGGYHLGYHRYRIYQSIADRLSTRVSNYEIE